MYVLRSVDFRDPRQRYKPIVRHVSVEQPPTGELFSSATEGEFAEAFVALEALSKTKFPHMSELDQSLLLALVDFTQYPEKHGLTSIESELP